MARTSRRPAATEAMLGQISAYWTSQLVFVAATLGLADELARRPLTAEALAKQLGVHAPSLRRVIRLQRTRTVT